MTTDSLPPESASNGTNPPSPTPSEVQRLAGLLDPDAFGPRGDRAEEWDRCCRRMLAGGQARRVLAAGYRLVPDYSDDPELSS
jgi:hypothetical protein